MSTGNDTSKDLVPLNYAAINVALDSLTDAKILTKLGRHTEARKALAEAKRALSQLSR